MKTKILHISALCALVVGLSGCTVHSSGTYAHVGGGIYASSGDYYHYHRAPIRERVVVVPQQRVVVAPRPVVVAPQRRVVVAQRPAVRPVVGAAPKHGIEVPSRRDMKPHHSFVRKDGKIPPQAKQRALPSRQVQNQKVVPPKSHGERESTKRYAKNLPPRPPHR